MLRRFLRFSVFPFDEFDEGAFFPTLLAVPIQFLEDETFTNIDAFGRVFSEFSPILG